MPSGHRSATRNLLAYVGCRTSRERDGAGDGISVYRIDGSSGRWELVQLVSEVFNPSFLAFDRSRRTLFTVHADRSDVSAYSIDPKSGMLAFLNTRDCGGPNPVHLVVDPSNRFLAVANYANGTVGILPIESGGALGAPARVTPLSGTTGPHKVQQQGLYPHHIPYDPQERFLVVPDKGGDQVCVFHLDSKSGAARLVSSVKTRSGSGPRHIAFHPSMPFAYLANELDSTIETFAWDADNGTLQPLQILTSLPETYTGNNTTAEIEVHPSGRHVFISNRGHDSIAIFAISDETGVLKPVDWQFSGGRQPRFFALDPSGSRLYAANELSHTITAFDVSANGAILSPCGEVAGTPSPTCIIFEQVD